jgi:hypothetical protein
MASWKASGEAGLSVQVDESRAQQALKRKKTTISSIYSWLENVEKQTLDTVYLGCD